jgi:putative MATE family efflux protein
MTLWISLALIALTVFNLEPIITVLGATEDIHGYAMDYYRAILVGFPFMSLSLVYFHQLNAQGEMRIAMRAMFLSISINILLDYLAIFVFDLGISGAGWATAVSQIIWYGYMHIKSLGDKNIHTVVQPFAIRINKKSAKSIVTLGFSSFVRQIGVSVALIIINTLAGRYGSSLHIAAFGATQRIIRLLIAPIAALSMAMKPIVGQNYGFGEYRRVRNSLGYAFRAAFLLGTFLLVLLFLLREPLGRLFGIADEQMDVFVKILLLTSCVFPLYGVQHLAVSYFTSLGKPKQALLLNLLKQVIFLIPMIYILPLRWGIYGLFLAMPVSDLLTIGISGLMVRRDVKTLGRELNKAA